MKLDVDVNGVVTGFNRESIVLFHPLIHIISLLLLPPIPAVVATEQAQKAKFCPFVPLTPSAATPARPSWKPTIPAGGAPISFSSSARCAETPAPLCCRSNRAA